MTNEITRTNNTNNSTVKINGCDMGVRMYQGQRVVTLKDVDMVHERADGTARRNFNANKERFIEGVDYFRIQPNEIRTVGITSPNGGIVITESGYLMLVKSFTDDLSWSVQRQLVNSYFKVKELSEENLQLLTEIHGLKSDVQKILKVIATIPQIQEAISNNNMISLTENSSNTSNSDGYMAERKIFTMKDNIEDVIFYIANYLGDNTKTKLKTRKMIYSQVNTERGWKCSLSRNHCQSKVKLLSKSKRLKSKFIKVCNDILDDDFNDVLSEE